jgi:hypothetical protein
LGRSASLNKTVSADIAITVTPDPARPISSRAARNTPGDVASAHSTEPAPNTARQTARSFLRPKRSPISPAGSTAAASSIR